MQHDEQLLDLIRHDIRHANEAHGSARWMVWAAPDGSIESRAVGPCHPTPAQIDWAIGLGRRLNRDASDGGQWLIVWCDLAGDLNLPSRLVMAWIDPDGDIPFLVDTDDTLVDMAVSGIDHFVGQAVSALRQYRDHIAAIEVAPGQMKRRRLGEPVADPRIPQPTI